MDKCLTNISCWLVASIWSWEISVRQLFLLVYFLYFFSRRLASCTTSYTLELCIINVFRSTLSSEMWLKHAVHDRDLSLQVISASIWTDHERDWITSAEQFRLCLWIHVEPAWRYWPNVERALGERPVLSASVVPSQTKKTRDVNPMLVWVGRRCPNIKALLAQRLVFAALISKIAK